MSDERTVSGLRCSEVLGRLSDYVDRALTVEERAHVEGHLAGCEDCARFGGELSATLRALKEHFASRATLPGDLLARLHEALKR